MSMNEEELIEEFEFLRDEIKQIADILVSDGQPGVTRAAFELGCLHSICHVHASRFKAEEKDDLD